VRCDAAGGARRHAGPHGRGVRGAQVLADRMIGLVGQRRAGMGLSLASLLMGFPIFFDAGLVVMLPIIYAIARRVGGSFLSIALPSPVAFSALPIFSPP